MIIDEIYYSKEYQLACRAPSEKFLFMQWMLDLVYLTEALCDSKEGYDRWYYQLFYIKLAGLFEVMQKNNSICTSDDRYIQKVKLTLEQIYNSLSTDEYIYIIYRRVSAAHPFQNGYDIFKESGEKYDEKRKCAIKGEGEQLSREDIDRAIGRVLDANGNDDKKCDINIVRKLSPHIMQLKEGLFENYAKSMKFF